MITKDVLHKVAKNARLSLTKEEEQEFEPQLNEVLEYFSTIKNADARVEPSFIPIRIDLTLREDTVEPSLTQQQALRNAQSKEGYIKGPKSI